MTPAARVQAAIELLDEIIAAARSGGAAADTLAARYFKTRRYAGAKDRRAIRDLVYRAVRAFGDMPASGRAAMLGLAQDDAGLAQCFTGAGHAPAAPGASEPVAQPSLLPGWLLPHLDPLLGEAELPALLDRAPLDLRVNRLRGTREEALALLPDAVPTPLCPIGLRLHEALPLETHPAWTTGLVEVQDEGSQLLALACRPRAGETVVDLCAGAGGKALALAAEMANEGRLIASDTDRARLQRMPPRLQRAGATIVEPRLLDPGRERQALADLEGGADLVLVDAPCSGSGTWRRNPETRWRLTPARLAQLTALQARLLDLGACLVKPSGRLVYAVCSVLAQEGRGQAAAFTDRSAYLPQFPAMQFGRKAGSGRLLSPGVDGTDGFFVACWQRPC